MKMIKLVVLVKDNCVTSNVFFLLNYRSACAIGDLAFKIPTITLLQVHRRVSTFKRGYAYEFQHKRAEGRPEGNVEPDWLWQKASHVDELVYVFGYPVTPKKYCPEWTDCK